MAYDAGSIDTRITGDKDPLIRALREAQTAAEQFARQRYAPTLTIDRSMFDRDLAAAEAKLQAFARQHPTATVRINTSDTTAAIDRLNNRVDTIARHTGVVSAQVQRHFNLMRAAIEFGVPAATAMAGGVLAIGSAVVGLGAAGVLAFKGITAEIKAGTAQGNAYLGLWRQTQGVLTTLERTASHGVFGGLSRGVNTLQMQLPAINNEIRTSSTLLGNIGSHVVGGLVALFRDFGPLIGTAEKYVDSLAQRFQSWAAGPGGHRFASTLLTDFHHLVPLLQQLLPLVMNLLSGANTAGLGAVDTLTLFSTAINHIPVGLLKAGVVAYIAFRAAVAVTTSLNAATAALTRFAAAEDAAAGAGAARGARGLAAASAGLLGRIAPLAAAYIGLTFAANAGANATDSWVDSINGFKSGLGGALGVAKDFLTLNWGGIGSEIDRMNAAVAASRQNFVISARLAQGTLNAHQLTLQHLQYYPAVQQGEQGMMDPAHPAGAFRSSAGLQDYRNYAGTEQQVIDNARKNLPALRREYDQSAATLAHLTAQYHNYVQSLGATNSRTIEAAHAVAAQKQAVQDASDAFNNANIIVQTYNQSLRQYQQVVRANNREELNSAASVRQRNLAGLGRAQTLGLMQTPDLGQAQSQLTAYQKSVQNAIKDERTWTKTTDDHTVAVHYQGQTWKVEQNVVAGLMQRYGGDVQKVSGIIAGHEQALKDDQAALANAAMYQRNLSRAVGDTEAKYKLNDQELNTYRAVAGITWAAVAQGTVTHRQFERAIGSVINSIKNGPPSMRAWATAVQTFEASEHSAADRAALLGQAMVSLNGDAINYQSSIANAAQASRQFGQDLHQVHAGVVDVKNGTIDFHRAGAAPLLADLSAMQQAAEQAAEQTYQLEVHTKGAKQAAADAATVYHNQTYGALVSQARQLGLTKTAAKNLADTYFHWPKLARTRIEQLGGDETTRALHDILNQLRILNGFKAMPTIGLNDTAARIALQDLGRQIDNLAGKAGNLNVTTALGHAKHNISGGGNATGTNGRGLPDGVSSVGEYGKPELVIKRGPHVEVLSNPQSKAFLALTGMRAPGFAGGTLLDYAHQGGFSGRAAQVAAAIAMAESGGNPRAHAQDADDDSYGLMQINMLGSMGPARRRQFGLASNAALFNPATNMRVAYALSGHGSNFSPWTTYDDGAYLQFMGTNAKVGGGGSGGGGGGGSGSGGSGLTRAQKLAQTRAQNAAALSQQKATFRSQQNPSKIFKVGGQWYFNGSSYDTHAEAIEAQRENRVTTRQSRADEVATARAAYASQHTGRIGKAAGQFFYGGQSFDSYDAAVEARREARLDRLRTEGQAARAEEYGGSFAHRNRTTIEDRMRAIATSFNAAQRQHVIPSALLRQFTSDNKGLDKALDARFKWLAKEKQARAQYRADQQAERAYQSNVRQTWMGTFDITSSGNGYAYGIDASLQQADANVRKFLSLRRRAVAMGLAPAIIQQFENSPNGIANLEAIVDAGQDFVNKINREYRQLGADTKTLAGNAARDKYEKKLADDTAEIRKDAHKAAEAQHRVTEELHDIRGLLATLEHDIHNHETNKRKKGS